ncbi:MAG: DUF1801 domain-containing protein [Armatimonadetes bacterium]|nr:DUF1801 domain-containing protein [Armatimonadota bacterium]
MAYSNSFTELVDPASPTPVDDYVRLLPPVRGAAFGRVVELVREEVEGLTQGVSYAMPTFFYRGKALVCLLECKNHLSYFPCSGRVVVKVTPELKGFSLSTGTVRFTPEQPLPEAVVRAMASLRAAEIDAQLAAKRKR